MLLRPDPDPPVPVHADLTAGGRVFACTFDRPLKVQPLNESNWFGVALNRAFTLNWVTVEGDQVIGNPLYGDLHVAPNRCNYLADPADVQSDQGVPAAQFLGFPLQVHG